MANISFGERIRRARIRSAMSQTDLAEKLGVTQGTISNWEKGKIKLDPAQRTEIKRVLGEVTPVRENETSEGTVEAGPSAFGAWLNRTRNEMKMSIGELAQASGLSSSTIYK